MTAPSSLQAHAERLNLVAEAIGQNFNGPIWGIWDASGDLLFSDEARRIPKLLIAYEEGQRHPIVEMSAEQATVVTGAMAQALAEDLGPGYGHGP